MLDASAVLCLLNHEPGHDVVAELLSEARLGVVNLAEVYTKLIDSGLTEGEATDAVDLLGVPIEPYDSELALLTARLRAHTRKLGLSPGERSCLAVALRLGAVAVTADGSWKKQSLCPVKVVR